MFTPNESVKSWTLYRLYLLVNNLNYFNSASNNAEDKTLIVQSCWMPNNTGKWYRNPRATDGIRNYNKVSVFSFCSAESLSFKMFLLSVHYSSHSNVVTILFFYKTMTTFLPWHIFCIRIVANELVVQKTIFKAQDLTGLQSHVPALMWRGNS